MRADGKLKKADVGYGPGLPHCGACKHYREDKDSERGTCEFVAGAIDEDFWCKLYKPKRSMTLAAGAR